MPLTLRPGGANTNVQFNDSGGFGGDADLVWNKTTNALGVLGVVGVGLAAPEADALVQFKDAGAAPVVNSGGSSADLLISQTDTTQRYAIALVNTDYSTDIDDGLSITQYGDGTVYFNAGNIVDPAVHFILDPANNRVQFFNPIEVAYDVTSEAAGSFTRVFDLVSHYTATNGDTTSGEQGIVSTVLVGNDGSGTYSAPVGSPMAFAADIELWGSGDAGNEPALMAGRYLVNIGTGYHQTTNCPRIWWSDWQLHGPIATKPETLLGPTFLQNNYYNGSPNDASSAALTLVTVSGPGDAIHQAATTYPNDIGLHILGKATGGTLSGFTTAVKVGGTGSGWTVAASQVGTGLDIADYTTRGIYVHGAIGTPTAAIEAVGTSILSHYYSPIYDISSGTAIAWTNGNVQKRTNSADVTFTFSGGAAGGRYALVITQSGGVRVITWPATVKWSGGTVPTPSASGKVDIYTFLYDGTSYYGAATLNN